MANEDRELLLTIEDYTGVTTSVVPAANQVRFYDNVTGYDSDEVIALVGDGTSTIAQLLTAKNNATIPGAKTFTGSVTFSGGASGIDYQEGYIYGLETVAAGDADHDVTIATGQCRSSDDTTNIDLSAAITKRIDATWAAGTGNGGLFSGTVAANTTYHYFVIYNPTSDTTDAGWDTNLNPTANLPSGYTKYRRIRSHLTDASSNIIDTIQYGDEFFYVTPISDTMPSISTSDQDVTLSVPSDIEVDVKLTFSVSDKTTGTTFAYVHPVATAAPTPTIDLCSVYSTTTYVGQSQLSVRSNTSSQISIIASLANGTYRETTIGYTDYRGRYDGN